MHRGRVPEALPQSPRVASRATNFPSLPSISSHADGRKARAAYTRVSNYVWSLPLLESDQCSGSILILCRLSRRRIPRATDAAARHFPSNVRRVVAEKFHTPTDVIEDASTRTLSSIKSRWRRALSTSVRIRMKRRNKKWHLSFITCRLFLRHCINTAALHF